MGRERARTWKFILFCITCLIPILLSGCAEIRDRGRTAHEEKESKKIAQCPPPASVRTMHARKLLAQGDIEGALKESQKLLAVSGMNPPADEALFTMGLANIHHKNPKRDYRQAMELFDRLVRDFPQSALADQAMTWIGVLHIIEQSKEVDIEIEKMKKELVR